MSLDYDTEADTEANTNNKAQQYYSDEQRAEFKQILKDAELNKKVIDSKKLKLFNDENKTVELMRQLKRLMGDNDNTNNPSSGGKKKVKPVKPAMNGKKEILGKQRCIYKKAGDRKEYVKYKGVLITVKDYKKVMKDITVKRNKNKK